MLLLPYGPIVASLSPTTPLLDPQLRTLVSAAVAHLLIDGERQHGVPTAAPSVATRAGLRLLPQAARTAVRQERGRAAWDQSREAHHPARPHHSPRAAGLAGCRVMAQPEHVEQDKNPAAGLIGWEGIPDSAAGPAQCGQATGAPACGSACRFRWFDGPG
jgi:hypothetical protein